LPLVGSISRSKVRPIVVLPQPIHRLIQRSPAAIENETSSTAFTCATVRDSNPAGREILFRCWTSTVASLKPPLARRVGMGGVGETGAAAAGMPAS